MKKKTIIQMVVGILFLLTLIISSTYAYFNIVNTSSNNTTSNYNAKLEDIEKYGTSLLTGGEGELHLRVKASDMTPSKIGNKYYATTSDVDYQLRRGNHIVSNATIQKGLSNYEYNCTSKLTITLDGTMVTEEGLQEGDAKLYLRGTNNNIKNEEYDLKNLIDKLETNSDGKKEYTREIEYLLTSDNEGKVMIDVEFANNSNNQTTSSGKNLNIEITNSELVCGLGNDKVYAKLETIDTNYSGNYAKQFRSNEWKNKIITASFVDYKPSEEELLTKPMYWDLTNTSKSEAGSVIGWLEEREEANTYDLYIGSDKDIYISTLENVFQDMSNLQEIKFDNLNTSETTNMRSMFLNCSKLTELDVSHFDTSKVTYMNNMFSGCSNLTSIDVSLFDTSQVTSMGAMFRGLNKLTELDVSNFDTSKVTNMNYMFENLNKLAELNVSNFDTSKVTSMSNMFSGCSNLATLDLNNFNTSQVDSMTYMFYNCSNLTSLDLSNFDTSNVTNMSWMFYNDTNLKTIDISNFDVEKVKSVSYMFYNTSATIIFPNNFGHNATTMSGMFNSYKGTTLDLSNFDTSSVTNMSEMFSSYQGTTLDVSTFVTSSVTNMSSMFYNCSNLTNLDVSNFNTSSVTNMSSMFRGCSKLTSLDVSHFDISQVTNMHNMFYGLGVKSLEDIKGLYEFDTSKVTDVGGIFASCKNLTEIDLTKFELDSVTDMSSMFAYLDGITSIDQIKGFKELDTSKVTNMSYMFQDSKITDLDLTHFDTSNVTNMSDMFNGCSKLTSLDLSSFETPLLSNTIYMFINCTNLKDLKLNKATFDKVTSYGSMFTSVKNDIHLTIKKDQEDFINKRLNDAKITNATIDLVD